MVHMGIRQHIFLFISPGVSYVAVQVLHFAFICRNIFVTANLGHWNETSSWGNYLPIKKKAISTPLVSKGIDSVSQSEKSPHMLASESKASDSSGIFPLRLLNSENSVCWSFYQKIITSEGKLFTLTAVLAAVVATRCVQELWKSAISWASGCAGESAFAQPGMHTQKAAVQKPLPNSWIMLILGVVGGQFVDVII